jgi:hypothetical protein
MQRRYGQKILKKVFSKVVASQIFTGYYACEVYGAGE